MVWEEKDGQGGFREAYFLRTVTRWSMSLQDSERMRRGGQISPMITQELGGLGKQLVLGSGRSFYQVEAPTHCPQLCPFHAHTGM